MAQSVINPATGDTTASHDEIPTAAALEVAGQAHACFLEWRRVSPNERVRPLTLASGLLRKNAGAYARLMAEEMGKPVREGRAEVEKCALVCEHYAEHADELLEPRRIETDARHSHVRFEPLGSILAIMPWNFPFWQVFRCAVPALAAGNTVLLKHASNVPGCALALEQLFRHAGLPEDAFRTLLIDPEQTEALIADPRVAAVTLTGSTGAGRAVARVAGQHLKKTVLELGGNDPYLILEDADLESAAAACAASRMINAGQSCIAAKRFIVVEPVREEFEALLVARMREYRFGDPLDPETRLGPLARLDLRAELHRQVIESIAAGARCLLGGEVPDGPGAFYPPTVLSGVEPGMPAYGEELFGPVAAVISARDELEAVRLANDSHFGLGAAVFTADPQRGERIAAEELEAGNCFVNAFVRSDPRLPFGGIKASGYGRELGSFGILEFVNVKTVYVG